MQVVVAADFFQYSLGDPQGEADFSRADDTMDGVIGPVGTAMRIATGMQHGPVAVELDFRDAPPALAKPDLLAAEADIELPSGTMDVWSFDGPRVARHTFSEPGLFRVRVEVRNRYEVSRDGTPAERHKITVWPVTASSPRWVSRHT